MIKPGDMVTFTVSPSSSVQKGLLISYRDNPSDVYDILVTRGVHMPHLLNNAPRQIAEVLCNGKIKTCWKAHLRPFVKNEDR